MQSLGKIDMEARRVVPPQGYMARLIFYSKRYGYLHAIFRYIFRNQFRAWSFIGPIVTKPYLLKWKNTSERRVLNLGGGSNCLLDCLTVDIDPRADCFVDITRKLPFDDRSIDAIFCEEAIEHISKNKAMDLLEDCFRILKVGGVIRITTPDLSYFCTRIIDENTGADEINTVFFGHGHRYLYNRYELRRICTQVGFVDISWSTYQDSYSQLGYLDSHADRFHHPPEWSLYAEMKKASDDG
jgi:predicted SAM-dependent methyltransferase